MIENPKSTLFKLKLDRKLSFYGTKLMVPKILRTCIEIKKQAFLSKHLQLRKTRLPKTIV